MKSLSLTRPLVMMVIGIPGAGKSFFARQFSDTFNAPVVSYDQLRYSIFEQPTYARAEESILQDLADYQIGELLKTHKTFIIDGGMNAKVDRMRIEKMARAADYGTLIIWVQTDEPTSEYRATKRKEGRKGDELNASITAGLFESSVKRLTPPSPAEPLVVISGKHTYATQAKVILKKLVSPREDSAPTHAPNRPLHNDQSPPTHRSITIN